MEVSQQKRVHEIVLGSNIRNVIREGVGYVKTQLSFILFIWLTTTCFGHSGLSSGHENK